jgi:hypothetical protein
VRNCVLQPIAMASIIKPIPITHLNFCIVVFFVI